MTARTFASCIEELWEDHFRHPAAAYARAHAVLAENRGADDEASTWARLTVGYHHLYFSVRPAEARAVLTDARAEFAARGLRRGELLAGAGLARLMMVEESPARARDWLLEIHAEAERTLKAQDRYWVAVTLGGAYFFTDRVEAAIRYLYDAFETLRTIAPSPQLPAVMTHLAAGSTASATTSRRASLRATRSACCRISTARNCNCRRAPTSPTRCSRSATALARWPKSMRCSTWTSPCTALRPPIITARSPPRSTRCTAATRPRATA
jgi:hypothetical protein